MDTINDTLSITVLGYCFIRGIKEKEDLFKQYGEERKTREEWKKLLENVDIDNNL
jgi:hypothetical protein